MPITSARVLLRCWDSPGLWKPGTAGTCSGKICLDQKGWKRISARDSTGPEKTLADCCCIKAFPAGHGRAKQRHGWICRGVSRCCQGRDARESQLCWARQHRALVAGASSPLRSAWGRWMGTDEGWPLADVHPLGVKSLPSPTAQQLSSCSDTALWSRMQPSIWMSHEEAFPKLRSAATYSQL